MSEEKRKYLAHDAGHGMTRPVVTVLLAMGIGIAYWVWPDGITDKSFGDIPASDLVQAAGAVLVGLFTVAVAVRAWFDF
jgi:integral membrane sensor domain MASE1